MTLTYSGKIIAHSIKPNGEIEVSLRFAIGLDVVRIWMSKGEAREFPAGSEIRVSITGEE
jgi:hypothetical protein